MRDALRSHQAVKAVQIRRTTTGREGKLAPSLSGRMWRGSRLVGEGEHGVGEPALEAGVAKRGVGGDARWIVSVMSCVTRSASSQGSIACFSTR